MTAAPAGALVFIVDDEEAVRDALGWLLRTRGLASRHFDSADAFMAFLDGPSGLDGQPACVLLDVRMDGTSGLELFDALRARDAHVVMPILFMTGHGDVPMAVDALKRGAFDFFEKPFSDNALVDRVIAALECSRQRLEDLRTHADIRARTDALTDREREVMRAILAGKLNKVIADELGISMRTVEVHRARIFAKMGVRSAVELANLVR